MSEDKFVIGDYKFDNIYDYKAAQEDIQKIELISKELNIQDPEVAIRLYNDIRDGIITFNSPIGQQFADHVGDIVANKSVGLLDDRALVQDAEGQAKYNKVIGLFCILAAVVVFGIYGYNEVSDIIKAKKLADLAQTNKISTETKENKEKLPEGVSNGEEVSDIENEGLDANSQDVIIWPTVNESELEVLPEMAELLEQNEDVIGWLTVDGTKIDYPVMQTIDEPSYYLDKSFEKKDSSAGTLFMDYRCDFVNPTTNTIIYGHNMKNLSMFGTLKYYLEPDFYSEHKTIVLKTLYEEREYQIIAVGLSQVADEENDVYKYYDFIENSSGRDLEEFEDAINRHSVYDEEIKISETDQLLTLSTCNSYTENGRLFIVAKRVK